MNVSLTAMLGEKLPNQGALANPRLTPDQDHFPPESPIFSEAAARSPSSRSRSRSIYQPYSEPAPDLAGSTP